MGIVIGTPRRSRSQAEGIILIGSHSATRHRQASSVAVKGWDKPRPRGRATRVRATRSRGWRLWRNNRQFLTVTAAGTRSAPPPHSQPADRPSWPARNRERRMAAAAASSRRGEPLLCITTTDRGMPSDAISTWSITRPSSRRRTAAGGYIGCRIAPPTGCGGV